MAGYPEFIPFNKPFIVGKELFNIARAVVEYGDLSGDGKFTNICQQWLESTLKCQKALLTHSCTAAWEMAAIICDAIGWLMWYMYLPPDWYNLSFVLIYTCAIWSILTNPFQIVTVTGVNLNNISLVDK